MGLTHLTGDQKTFWYPLFSVTVIHLTLLNPNFSSSKGAEKWACMLSRSVWGTRLENWCQGQPKQSPKTIWIRTTHSWAPKQQVYSSQHFTQKPLPKTPYLKLNSGLDITEAILCKISVWPTGKSPTLDSTELMGLVVVTDASLNTRQSNTGPRGKGSGKRA